MSFYRLTENQQPKRRKNLKITQLSVEEEFCNCCQVLNLPDLSKSYPDFIIETFLILIIFDYVVGNYLDCCSINYPFNFLSG